MKFKTYRIIDLTILIVFAFGLEILCTWLENSFLGRIRPYPVLGLLFTLVAVARWGWIGLIVAPIDAVGNFIAGKFMLRTASLRDTYTFLSLILSTVSNLTIAIPYAIQKKLKKKIDYHRISDGVSVVVKCVLINFLINSILFYISNLFGGIQNEGTEGIGAVLISQLLFNVIGYIVMLLGVPILGAQGTLDNVKDKLLTLKEEKEHEKQYYNQ